jgi:hypothetical protein
MYGGTDRAGGDTGADAVEAAVAVVLGTTVVAWRLLGRVATPARGAATSLLSAVVGPAASGPTAERGRALRAQGTRVAALALQQVTRQVLGIVLPALDLTELVLTHVDLDRIASGLDLDAAVARVDLDAAVARVDLDAVVDRLDLDAVVARVDLAAIVDRIDVEAVASRIDLDRLAEGLDLQAIVDRLDLDAVARASTPISWSRGWTWTRSCGASTSSGSRSRSSTRSTCRRSCGSPPGRCPRMPSAPSARRAAAPMTGSPGWSTGCCGDRPSRRR